MLTVILFLGSAAAIYFACEFFVNGVEWLGRKLGVGETATGTILAAFGTALPESAVTFVAVVFGRDSAQKDIGVGAALGGPLVLATLSYAVVGFALLWNHRRLGRATPVIECDSKKIAPRSGLVSVHFRRQAGTRLCWCFTTSPGSAPCSCSRTACTWGGSYAARRFWPRRNSSR